MTHSPKDNFVGSLQMIIAMGSFSASDVFIKLMNDAIPASQFIVIRSLIGLVMIWLYCQVSGTKLPIKMAFQPRIILRSLAEFLAAVLIITALTKVTYANIAAIMQSVPLVVVAGAAVFFSEKIGWRRMLAILAGTIGVMMVIQPGLTAFNSAALLVVGAALFAAVRDLMTRTIDKAASGLFISFATLAWLLPLSLGASVYEGWRPMNVELLLLTAAATAITLLGYSAIVSAMRTGEINYVTPFRYSALIFAPIFGYFIFSEVPNALAILGTLVIVAAGLYTFLRERQLAKQQNKS